MVVSKEKLPINNWKIEKKYLKYIFFVKDKKILMQCNVQLSRHCALFRRRFFFLFSVIILHGFWRWGRREKWALLCSIRFCSAQCSQKFSEIIAILATNTFQLSYSGGLLHSSLISPSKSNFSLIFSCLKLKLFQTFWGLWCTMTSSKIFSRLSISEIFLANI